MVAIQTAQCFTKQALAQFASGCVDADQLERMAAHIDTCMSCQITISGLDDQPDSFVMNLKQLPAQPEGVEDSACQAVVSQLVQRHADPGQGASELPPIPTQIGGYRVLELAGAGGMGLVYKAQHPKLKRLVAIKLLPVHRSAGPAAIARFQREMEVIGSLDHPNIVRASDAGDEAGMHYLVMDYVNGLDLSRLVRRVGPLGVADACEIVSQAARGLAHVHDASLVHRDIKPSNVMVTQDGHVKILDLGLAMLSQQYLEGENNLTTIGQLMGTLDYMAPEQAADSHQVDTRADIYSLGATLFQLLTGQAPYGGPRHNSLLKKVLALANAPVPSLREIRAEVPRELDQIIGRCLAKEPDQRYANVDEVIAALAEFSADADLVSLIHQAAEKPEPDRFRHSAWSMAAVFGQRKEPDKSQADVASAGDGKRIGPLAQLLAASALFGFLMGAIWIFRLATDRGELIVRSEDPNARILVKQTDGQRVEELTLEQGQGKLTIRSGQYSVELASDADRWMLSQNKFTISRGDRVVLTVEEKATKPKLEKGMGSSGSMSGGGGGSMTLGLSPGSMGPGSMGPGMPGLGSGGSGTPYMGSGASMTPGLGPGSMGPGSMGPGMPSLGGGGSIMSGMGPGMPSMGSVGSMMSGMGSGGSGMPGMGPGMPGLGSGGSMMPGMGSGGSGMPVMGSGASRTPGMGGGSMMPGMGRGGSMMPGPSMMPSTGPGLMAGPGGGTDVDLGRNPDMASPGSEGGSGSPTSAANEELRSRLVYDGKSYNDWLTVIETERSPTRLLEAVTAISVLVPEAESEQAARALLRVMRAFRSDGLSSRHLVVQIQTTLLRMDPNGVVKAVTSEIHQGNSRSRHFLSLFIQTLGGLLNDPARFSNPAQAATTQSAQDLCTSLTQATPGLLPELIDLSRSSDLHLGRWALEFAVALASLPGADIQTMPNLVARLQEGLKSEDDQTRFIAATVLSRWAPESEGLAEVLVQYIGHPDRGAAAIEMIGRLGHHASSIVPQLVELFASEADAAGPRSMEGSLGVGGSMLPGVGGMTPGIPGQILSALAQLGPSAKAALPVLRRYAEQEGPYQELARQMLEKLQADPNESDTKGGSPPAQGSPSENFGEPGKR